MNNKLYLLSWCLTSVNDDGSDTQTSSTIDTVASMTAQNVLMRHSPNSMDVDVLISRPFAMVDEIADASPAVEDGLQLGDQILKFGNVEAGDNLLQRLSSEAQSNLGRAVPVVIVRQGTVINITITPRSWQGRGLLGYACCLSIFCFCLVCLISILQVSFFMIIKLSMIDYLSTYQTVNVLKVGRVKYMSMS